jgi:hypothetical protein
MSGHKLKHFKNEKLNLEGSYYVDNSFELRENLVPYDVLASVQMIVKVLDDNEADLITMFVLEIPSLLNDNHYIGYVLENPKRSKVRKGNIIGFKQDHIHRFGLTIDKPYELMEYTKEISLTYLLYIQNMRKGVI